MKKLLALLAMIASVAILACAVSCSDDDDDSSDSSSSVDLTELQALVDSCQAVLDAATTDDYPQSAITAFESTLTSVISAMEGDLTQTQVSNLIVNLRAAAATFEAASYSTISDDDIIFKLSFDEGSGTSLTTEGSYSWTAVLQEGPSEVYGTDTSVPTFVEGVSGYGMHFEDGGHLTIDDYTASILQGSELSISVWVNPSETFANNYIISYNYWNSWKLNIQDAGKPFFTVYATGGCVDMDNETDNSVPVDTWTHVVVSMDLGEGTVSFYINGSLTKTWNSSDKGDQLYGTIQSYSSSVGTLPICIGTATTYEEAEAEWSSWWDPTPDGWNCFRGDLDELVVYSAALSSGQVAKLYASY